jgi:hypothetical protein
MEASHILFTALYLEGWLRSARQGMLALRVMNAGASPDIPCDVIKSCILRNGNMPEGGQLSGGARCPWQVCLGKPDPALAQQPAGRIEPKA